MNYCTFCNAKLELYHVNATITKKDLGQIQRVSMKIYVCKDCDEIIKKLKWQEIINNKLFDIESVKNYVDYKEQTDPDKLPNPKITRSKEKSLLKFGGNNR